MAATTPYSTDVAVLGAGPYGLSVYAHLRRHSVQARIFGEPMHSWHSGMPAGMRLTSESAECSIAADRPGFELADYCRASGAEMPAEHEQVPIELFRGYGDWFAEALAPEIERTTITAVDRDGPDRFRVAAKDGEEISVRAVVIASGPMGHAYIPPELAPLTAEAAPVTHSSQHEDLSVFAGQKVAVVGAGQSALESAALLAEADARPTVLARRPRLAFTESPFAPPARGVRGLYQRIPRPRGPLGPGWRLFAAARGPALIHRLPAAARLALTARLPGPAGEWWLRDRVEGRLPVHTGTQVVGASMEGGRVALKLVHEAGDAGSLSPAAGGESTLLADHVISATGYRIGQDAFPFLGADLRGSLDRVDNWPRLRAHFQSSVSGIYFVGFPSAASYGPLMRFICGTGYASPRITRALMARIKH